MLIRGLEFVKLSFSTVQKLGINGVTLKQSSSAANIFMILYPQERWKSIIIIIIIIIGSVCFEFLGSKNTIWLKYWNVVLILIVSTSANRGHHLYNVKSYSQSYDDYQIIFWNLDNPQTSCKNQGFIL